MCVCEIKVKMVCLNPPMRLFIGLCWKKKKKNLPGGLRHFALRAADRLEYSTQRIGLSSAGQLSLSLHGEQTIFDNCSLLIN